MFKLGKSSKQMEMFKHGDVPVCLFQFKLPGKIPDFQRSCLMLFVSLPVRVPSLKFRVPGTSPVAASTRRDVLAPQRLLGTEIGINHLLVLTIQLGSWNM